MAAAEDDASSPPQEAKRARSNEKPSNSGCAEAQPAGVAGKRKFDMTDVRKYAISLLLLLLQYICSDDFYNYNAFNFAELIIWCLCCRLR